MKELKKKRIHCQECENKLTIAGLVDLYVVLFNGEHTNGHTVTIDVSTLYSTISNDVNHYTMSKRPMKIRYIKNN